MSFNFGGFAGGFSDGFGSGVRMGKTMRDIIREKKMQETLQNARDEAAAAYDASQAGKARSVSEGPSTEGASYKAESGAVVTPVRPAEVVSTGLPPIGQESPASAAIPPSVANQTPAAPGSGASAEGNAGEAEAKTAMVKPTPQQAASAGIAAPGPAKFTTTDGKAFDTRKDAEAAAGVKNDPMARSMYIQKHMAQKAQDYFLSIGDMEMAEKYGKHAETVAGKQAIKAWADAKSAPDIDTRAQRFGQYYTDHINDGVDYTGHKILTKEDGTQVAVVSLKDKQTGKTSEMELTDQKMVELGDAWNPAAVFKNEQGRAAAAAAQKAKTGEEVLKSNLRMREKAFEQDRIDAREGAKGRQTLSEISLRDQIERQNAGAKVTAELTAKTDALKAYGYTEEEIKPLVPLFLKVGEYKKMTDPAERRAIIGTELMKSDPTYSRATAEEQRARIDKAMAAIFGEAAPAQPGQPAPATPATSGVPPRPVYVRDKTTGQIFQIQGDKKIPVGPPPKPPAAPAAPVPPAGAQSAIPPSPAAMAAGGIPARGSGLNLVPR
jgi:hypothetical protein